MPYRLPSHVSFCEVEGQVIVLDLLRDRYLQLPTRLAETIRALKLDRTPLLNQAALTALLDQNLLEVDPLGVLLKPARSAPPIKSVFETAQYEHGFHALDLLRASLDLACLQRRISRHHLWQAVHALERSKNLNVSIGHRDSPDVVVVTRAFLAVRRLVPIPTVCLLDSLALGRRLFKAGADVKVVFGVKLNPFRAHAWVQSQDLLLNDSLDRVLPHHPIRVI